jgi:hypothetical protein
MALSNIETVAAGEKMTVHRLGLFATVFLIRIPPCL